MIETKIQMRFADVDMFRHVNNVNQQHYFDLGKHDYFTAVLGIAPGWLKQGVITVATHTSYLGQIPYNSHVVVGTRLVKLGTKSFTLFQQIYDGDTGEVKSESRSVMVAFDFEKQESIPIPDSWRDLMAAREGLTVAENPD